MTVASKRRLAGAVLLVCAVGMVVCIARAIPPGMNGDTGKVKVYFALMVVAFVPGVLAAVAYYYYRAAEHIEDAELQRMRAETDILAQAGHKPMRPLNQPSGKK